jgi:hypothetical protein
MFTNLRQLKTQLHADVPIGNDADGRVTLHIVVPTFYVRTPDKPLERRVRDALGELNAALTDLGQHRLNGLGVKPSAPASAGAPVMAPAPEPVKAVVATAGPATVTAPVAPPAPAVARPKDDCGCIDPSHHRRGCRYDDAALGLLVHKVVIKDVDAGWDWTPKASELTTAGVFAVLAFLTRRDEITQEQAEQLRKKAFNPTPPPAPATATTPATTPVGASATGVDEDKFAAAYARIREDVVIAALDRAGLAADAGRVQAREALRRQNIQASNDVLRAALRRRHGGNA